jgi:hypothetical protein
MRNQPPGIVTTSGAIIEQSKTPAKKLSNKIQCVISNEASNLFAFMPVLANVIVIQRPMTQPALHPIKELPYKQVSHEVGGQK